MHQPVTIVKVRRDTIVKVKAGDWVLIGTPNQSLSDQLARVQELVKDGHVNDDYEALTVGRITDVRTPTRFITKAENKANAKQTAANNTALAKSNDDAKQREADRKKAAEEAAAQEHAAKLEEINKVNDSIRKRDPRAASEIVSGVQLETATEGEDDSVTDEETAAEGKNEFHDVDLRSKPQGELLTIASSLVASGRLSAMPTGSKSKIITAILSAPPVAPAATSETTTEGGTGNDTTTQTT